MGYWLTMGLFAAFFLTMLAYLVYAIIKERKLKEYGEKGDGIALPLIGTVITAALAAFFAMDIPCALRGGNEFYVDGFPQIVRMQTTNWVAADGKLLFSNVYYDPNDYDQDARYRITYTEVTNSVLNIEMVEQ